MMDWTPEKRPIKLLARELFFRRPGFFSHSYLTLPGRQCMDIACGFENEYLTDDTIIQTVEKNELEWRYICQTIAEKYPNQPDTWLGDMHNYQPIEPLDLVFLDYCGSITAADAYWQNNILSNNLLPGAKIGITLNPNERNNKFIKMYRDNYRNDPGLWKFISKSNNLFSGLDKKSKVDAALYCMLLESYCFVDFDLNMQFHAYCDTQPMYLILLSNMTPKTKRTLEEDANFNELKNLVNRCFLSSGASLRIQQSEIVVKPSVPVPSVKVSKMSSATFPEVVQKCYEAEMTKSPQKRAWATMYTNKYIEQRVQATGSEPKRILAAIKAAVTRKLNTL